jgi:hypothetical protein
MPLLLALALAFADDERRALSLDDVEDAPARAYWRPLPDHGVDPYDRLRVLLRQSSGDTRAHILFRIGRYALDAQRLQTRPAPGFCRDQGWYPVARVAYRTLRTEFPDHELSTRAVAPLAYALRQLADADAARDLLEDHVDPATLTAVDLPALVELVDLYDHHPELGPNPGNVHVLPDADALAFRALQAQHDAWSDPPCHPRDDVAGTAAFVDAAEPLLTRDHPVWTPAAFRLVGQAYEALAHRRPVRRCSLDERRPHPMVLALAQDAYEEGLSVARSHAVYSRYTEWTFGHLQRLAPDDWPAIHEELPSPHFLTARRFPAERRL